MKDWLVQHLWKVVIGVLVTVVLFYVRGTHTLVKEIAPLHHEQNVHMLAGPKFSSLERMHDPNNKHVVDNAALVGVLQSIEEDMGKVLAELDD